MGQVMSKNILQKLDKSRKLWDLLFPYFWSLLPRIYFWEGNWGLDCVPTQYWDSSNISEDLKTNVVWLSLWHWACLI